MCKFWRQEKSNHHFPELNRGKKMMSCCQKFFTLNRLAVALILLTAVCGFFCVREVNTSATSGYKISELEDKLSLLKDENKKLNLQYIELQSIANISDKVKDLNLVAVDKVEVVASRDSQVALK